MTASAPCIAFVAGEASGDLLAAPVVRELHQRLPGLTSVGVAGDRMIAAGCQPWHHVRELSVRGYVEVLRELPRLLRLRSTLAARLRGGAVSALVGVDSPDFNLALEAKVRAAGIPTVHYVSPSVWAWRRERMERIRAAADRILLVFPFEQEIYAKARIPASYVGHPLASSIPAQPDRAAARQRLGLPQDARILCLLPGSRRAEVAYIAPVFLEAARRLGKAMGGLRFVLPVADASLRGVVEQLVEHEMRIAGAHDPLPLELVDGRSHDCLEACDGTLVASGTATLEAALYQRPMVIAYRVPPLSAWIMRRIGGYLPWVGLPNILAGEALVPELLQEQATGAALAAALQRVLEDDAGQRRIAERFQAMHAALRRDTPRLAADAILQTMNERARGPA